MTDQTNNPVQPETAAPGNSDTPPAGTSPQVSEVDAGAAATNSPLGTETPSAETDPWASSVAWKLPEGVTLDEKQTADFGTLAKELGLRPDGAQKLLDFYGPTVKSIVEGAIKASNDASVKAYEETTSAWRKELEAIPEFSGANRTAAQSMIGGFLDQYFSPEARQAFDLTGAGWNPHIVQGMLKAAKALSEGAMTPQGGPPGARRGQRTLGESLYGSTEEKGNG